MLLWGITYEAPSYLTLPPLDARSPFHSPHTSILALFIIFLHLPAQPGPRRPLPPFPVFSALLPHVFILPSFLRSTAGASFHFSAAELLADVRANFPKWSGDASKANRCQWASRLNAAKR